MPQILPNGQDRDDVVDAPGCNLFLVDEDGPEWVVVREPLYRNHEDKIVHENDLSARYLYAAVGTRLTRAEAEAKGIIAKAAQNPASTLSRPAADKSRSPRAKKA